MTTTIKSYTDLEQSKKLAEILPLESADMWFANGIYLMKTSEEPKDIKGVFHCWSLAALLGLIPKEQHPKLVMNANYKWICDIIHPSSFAYKPTAGDNPVDACYEMIIRLNELNLL